MDPPTNGDLQSWLLWGVIIVVSALTTAVGILYRAAEGRNGKAISELEKKVSDLDKRLQDECKSRLECEKERAKQSGELEYLKHMVAEHDRKIS